MDSNDLINKLFNSLDELISQGYDVGITKTSNELLNKLEIIKNCDSCKYKIRNYYYFLR